jgi:hypothetical protein
MSALILLAAVTGMSAPAVAADLRHDVLPPGDGGMQVRARLGLETLAALATPTGPLPAELAPEPVVLRAADAHTVRFAQTHRGLPVLGGGAAVRVLPDGAVPFAVDALARDLTVAVDPGLSLTEALSRTGLDAHPVHKGALAVLPEGAGRLVWDLRAITRDGPEQWLVDAQTGVVLRRQSTLRHSLGRVYQENPVTTPDTSDLELLELDTAERLTGWGGGLQVQNHESGSIYSEDVSGAEVGPSDSEDFLYDPPADTSDSTDEFAAVNAYYHLSRARSWFSTLTGEDMSAEAWDLVVITNYQDANLGGPVDNAFYADLSQFGGTVSGAGNLIAIGQGSSIDFALDADVFVHEAGHWVSNRAVGYNQGQLYATEFGLSPWGGAIDEGISDYFAASLFDDPVLGDYVLATFGADRDLSAETGHCPEDIAGEVHEDGRLIGILGWTLREAYGAEAADQMIWGATTLLTADATLQDFAAGVTQIAQELLDAGAIDDLVALEQALDASGLDDCGTTFAIDDAPLQSTVWGLDLMGAAVGVDCATAASMASLHGFFHFRIDSTDADTGLRFDVELDPIGSGDLDWQLYLRAGEPVTFSSGMFVPEIDDWDATMDPSTETTGSLVLEGDDFTPGETWYGVIVSKSCPSTVVTISGEALTEGDGEDSGDDGGDDGGDTAGESSKGGGCGCTSIGAAAPTWLLSIFGLLLVRRRP